MHIEFDLGVFCSFFWHLSIYLLFLLFLLHLFFPLEFWLDIAV